LRKLGRKEVTRQELFHLVKNDLTLIPVMIEGVYSDEASIRYGCAKVLTDLSECNPEALYPYMDRFFDLLANDKRILAWNSLAIIANLTSIDLEKKFDEIFEEYYSFMGDEYMVTVANVVANSAKIAVAKPYLIPRIVSELLKVEDLTITPHLSEECKMVIEEHAVKSFDAFFDQVETREPVLSFVKRLLNSPRASLRSKAQTFLNKWDNE
jgi:hypothetical protein